MNMKKNTLFTLMPVLFLGIAGFVIFKYQQDEKKKATAMYELQDRRGPSATSAEWALTKSNFTKLSNAVKADGSDTKSMIALANLFIMEGRATGNYAYYDMAAMRYVNTILKKESENFEALTLKSLLYLSQHHFAEGLALAKKAKAINPYNAFVYGISLDGNVEMGNYDSALVDAEKMMSIRPDLRSYSRASYLREIHGDYPGAIQAMKLAVESGASGDESTEWSRIQLGHLYENTGDLKNAEMHYRIALEERPGYAYALAGLARIALSTKDYGAAINLYKQADSSAMDNSFKEELAEVYLLSGQKDKSTELSRKVIEEMNKNSKGDNGDENIGHYADRELAYAYLKTGEYDKALDHAMMEYNRRPLNIDVNETVAWVYYKKGDYTKAQHYQQVALRTNSRNPTLLCRTGLIWLKNGDKIKAKEYLQQGLKNDPNIGEALKMESTIALNTI